jgi:hypothetical protein
MKCLNILMVILLVVPNLVQCSSGRFLHAIWVSPLVIANMLSPAYDSVKSEKMAPKVKRASNSSRPLTPLEKTAVGGVVGAAEVVLPGQLLSYLMNCKIKGEKFVARLAYNGCAVNALGQMPITAVQMGAQSGLSKLVQNHQQKDLSDTQKLAVSYGAGVSGALIDTPSNAVQLYLQNAANSSKNTWQAMKALGKNCYKGFLPNALLKEGPFAVGYQILGTKGKNLVAPYVGDNMGAVALGGAGAGVLTAVLTQPGAVIRNTMQANPNAYPTLKSAVQNICKQQGVGALWKGLVPRGTRIAIAVPLYVAYTQKLEDLMRKYRQ